MDKDDYVAIICEIALKICTMLLMKNKQTWKYKISLEGSAGGTSLSGVRILVASADVNLKRQMITPEAEKIMWYYSLRYQSLIRHFFFLFFP